MYNVERVLKSVHVCQRYHKKSALVFFDLPCRIVKVKKYEQYVYVYEFLHKTVVTCKIKHLQNICKNVSAFYFNMCPPLKMFCKCFSVLFYM